MFSFNSFFIKKIEDLKANVDPNLVSDPLKELKDKMSSNSNKFELKTINMKSLKESIKQLKAKKSAGNDGMTQSQLKEGASVLASPLLNIINSSISKGQFPSKWKEGIVTPVFKKGDVTELENYRPVTCLPAAAKLLEKVACQQTSKYMEDNNLLPPSQHGFRTSRSTMTALTEVQKQWAENSENKEKTGILMWDLSAAFDCLDINIMCDKLVLYGFQENTVKWFRSFLASRSQRVKIGEYLSNPINLQSGVPQGGIISPLLYIIYVADLQLWLKFSKVTTYADDTKTCVSHKLLNKMKEMLEHHALRVLQFMASNGLVANPKKTAFMILINLN